MEVIHISDYNEDEEINHESYYQWWQRINWFCTRT